MFALQNDVSAAKRVIATLLALAVVMWTIGFYSTAEAANITSVSDLMSDTSPAASSNHTITFTSYTGVPSTGGTITITFPTGFSLSGVTPADIGLSVGGTAQTVASTPTGTTWGAGVTGQTITLTDGSSGVTAGQQVIVTIGTNTSGGTNQITNPTPTNGDQSFEISISAGTDNGYTRVVILNTVLVTAQVATTFNFNVYGVSTSTSINGTSTTGQSGSTTIPFGKLTAGQIKTLGQHLTVATNAANGFVVTVHDDGNFKSSTGAVIDDFKDGTVSATPQAWTAPANNVNNPKTWGHWGITSTDHSTFGARANEFATDTWVGVTTTPIAVFAHNGPSDGTTNNIGSTSVAYQVEISPLQEAGDDYSTTLTYVATPTF